MKTRLFACLSMALLISILVIFPSRQASAGGASSAGSQLEIIGKDGAPAGYVPLRHTAIRTEISGFVARISLTQQFENPGQVGPHPVGVELPSWKICLVSDGGPQQLAPAAQPMHRLRRPQG